jgi:hypothetical protein
MNLLQAVQKDGRHLVVAGNRIAARRVAATLGRHFVPSICLTEWVSLSYFPYAHGFTKMMSSESFLFSLKYACNFLLGRMTKCLIFFSFFQGFGHLRQTAAMGRVVERGPAGPRRLHWNGEAPRRMVGIWRRHIRMKGPPSVPPKLLLMTNGPLQGHPNFSQETSLYFA